MAAAKDTPKTPQETKPAEPPVVPKAPAVPEIEVKPQPQSKAAPQPEDREPTRAEDFEAFLRDPENEWARDIALKVISDFTSTTPAGTPSKVAIPPRPGFIVGNKGRTLAPDPPPQVAVEEKLVTITPRKSTENVRIGGKWYQFVANKPQQVSPSIRDHLREKGII